MQNKNVTPNIIQLIIDAAPDSVSSVSNEGYMPLHYLCFNEKVDETTAVKILRFLLEKCPEAVRHADSEGRLPIHVAASEKRSPEFCRVLIEANPGSERMTNADGELPLHLACLRNTVAMVEYLYNLFPNAINTTTTWRYYPIQAATQGIRHRNTPAASVEVVQFLLNCDPSVKLQKHRGTRSLLHFACGEEYNDSDINAALEVIKVIYDFYPEAIEEIGIISNIQNYHNEVQVFILTQLGHARQAKVHRQMTTPDMSGQLPLHVALRNNSVSFGSIKLLLKGNPNALQSADNRGRLPLHVACQYYESVSVIQYLVERDATTLDAVDRDGNTALHLICRCARHDVISLLLDEFDAVSVSKRNADEKLPIDLLWESNAVKDRGFIEYTESMYRLLRANPEMIMGCDVQQMQSSASSTLLPYQNGKKRRLDQ